MRFRHSANWAYDRHTVLQELQKDLVKTGGLIMSCSRSTRKVGPLICAGPENPELPAGRSWIVEHGCACRDKFWASLQSGCDLVLVRLRVARGRRLSVGDDSGDQY